MSGRFSKLEVVNHLSQQTDATAQGTTRRDAAYHHGLATSAVLAGRHEHALQAYTRCLKEDRTFVPAWVGQVQMLVELSEYDEAQLWANKALELFKNNGDLLAAKAQACLRIGDTKSAMIASDRAIAAPGSSPLRWMVRGELLLSRSVPRARDCLNKALAEPAADWFDRVLVARLLLFHQHAAAALDFAQQAIAVHSAHPCVWLTLGNAQAACGLTDAAVASFQRCMQLPPRMEEAPAALEAALARSRPTSVIRRMTAWFRK